MPPRLAAIASAVGSLRSARRRRWLARSYVAYLPKFEPGIFRGQRLYLFRLDRLTRTGIADTLTTLEELRAHGVEVVSVADGFDLGGPHAEIIVAVMAWAAKMERLAIGQRIAAARERVQAEGGNWGRPRRVDTPTLERARKMRAAGKSIREMAMALKEPKSTIAGALAAASEKPTPKTTPNRPARVGGPAGVVQVAPTSGTRAWGSTTSPCSKEHQEMPSPKDSPTTIRRSVFFVLAAHRRLDLSTLVRLVADAVGKRPNVEVRVREVVGQLVERGCIHGDTAKNEGWDYVLTAKSRKALDAAADRFLPKSLKRRGKSVWERVRKPEV